MKRMQKGLAQLMTLAQMIGALATALPAVSADAEMTPKTVLGSETVAAGNTVWLAAITTRRSNGG